MSISEMEGSGRGYRLRRAETQYASTAAQRRLSCTLCGVQNPALSRKSTRHSGCQWRLEQAPFGGKRTVLRCLIRSAKISQVTGAVPPDYGERPSPFPDSDTSTPRPRSLYYSLAAHFRQMARLPLAERRQQLSGGGPPAF